VEDYVTADRSIVLKEIYDDLNRHFTTPLHLAVINSRYHSEDVSRDWSWESRERASRTFEIVLFLINSKADVNVRESRGSGDYGDDSYKKVYPLWTACHFGDLKLCRLLVDSKADVAATNEVKSNFVTALRQAEHEGHSEIVDYLRSIGAPSCYRSEIYDDAEEHEHSFAHTCQFQSHRPW
jgi:ankyrin repeat protein